MRAGMAQRQLTRWEKISWQKTFDYWPTSNHFSNRPSSFRAETTLKKFGDGP